MRDVIKGIKGKLSNLFSDYRYLEADVKKEKKVDTKELAALARTKNPKTASAYDSTFQEIFGFKTKIIYTDKTEVMPAAAKRIEEIWHANTKTLNKKQTKLEQSFAAYLKDVENGDSLKYASRFEIRKVNDKVGMGLFAKENIRKGEIIGQYAGVIDFEKKTKASDYMFGFEESPFHELVICPRTKGNYIQFINHAGPRSKKRNAEPNAFFQNGQIHIILFALRAIKKGEEIAYDYGRDYWKNLDRKPV